MTANGLRFAPAVSGGESYYTALHSAMVAYDDGIPQLVTRNAPLSGGPSGSPDGKEGGTAPLVVGETSTLTFGSGRTNVLLGAVDVLLFLAYLMLISEK